VEQNSVPNARRKTDIFLWKEGKGGGKKPGRNEGKKGLFAGGKRGDVKIKRGGGEHVKGGSEKV